MRNGVGGQQRLSERNRSCVEFLLQPLFDLHGCVVLQLFCLQEWSCVGGAAVKQRSRPQLLHAALESDEGR